ncbi:MAG: SusC/RagA family TonB-linked outer membrane protein [Flavicella sp.]
MKKSNIVSFLFILPFLLFSQSKEITGTVLDENNSPLPGVNITIKDMMVGTSSDFDGNFILKVPENAKTLVFSYTGYLTKEVPLTNAIFYNLAMVVDGNLLEEVVVIGYGTVLKSDLTGSVSTVKVEENVSRQSSTVDQLLQGRAAGVQVIQNGQPGGGISVRIRGASSLRGNNEPLYVVDGVIISSAGEDAARGSDDGNSYQESQNGLNGINPRDIESMEVLKDASATAIYGSRGANGVVLITTKKGTRGKMNINSYSTTSVSELTKSFDMLNPIDYARYRNESNLLVGNSPLYHIENGDIYAISEGVNDTEPLEQVNWQDRIYQLGISSNVGLSFSGGSENGNFYISTGYNSQGGVVENSLFQNGDVRVNLSQQVTEKLKLNIRLSGFYAEGEFAQDGERTSGQRSFISNILRYDPVVGRTDDGLTDNLRPSNPYSWIDDFEDVSKESRFFGNMALTYSLPIEGLKYKIQVGGNMRNKERRRFYGLTTYQGSANNGLLAVSNLDAISYQVNNLLQFNKTFNRKHRFNAVLGITYDVRNNNNQVYEMANFATVDFGNVQPVFAQLVTRPTQALISKTKLLSYLGRVNYTLRNKYIFTTSFRVDGSSKFQGNNKYGFFPSGSFAWKLHKENFLQNSSFVNELKLRTGWGRIGNQSIAAYQTNQNYGAGLYATSDEATAVSFSSLNIPNKDLKWETTEQVNIGVDFGFLNNRLRGTVDAYYKDTKDLLQTISLPKSTGYRTMLINRGSLINKGLEFSLNGALVNKESFRLDVGGNIAFNRSKITSLGIPDSKVLLEGRLQNKSYYLGDNISTGTYFKAPANIFIKGEEVGLFYGYQTDGIYQQGDAISVADSQVGDIKIIDQLTEDTDNDGIADAPDGVIDAKDRTIIGNPNPDYIYGLTVDMKYKRFNLNVLMNGVAGNDIANGNLLRITSPEGNGGNILAAAYHNAWREDRPSNSYPRIGYNKEQNAIAITDRIIEDGSYFRISNVTLGYDVPITGAISKLNIYMSGINLWTFTGYSGYNPEITNFLNNGNILGVDWNGFPNTRTFLFGVNVNF